MLRDFTMRFFGGSRIWLAVCLGGLACGWARAGQWTTSPASGYTVRTWQSEDGLPQNTVNDILQTRDGYLWFATLNGVARFDGVRFRVFGLRDGLLTAQARCLLEDRSGALWIGTYGGGVSRLKDGRIENWTQGATLGGNVINALAEDGEGAVWIGTAGGPSRYREGRMEIVTNGLPTLEVRHLLAASASGGLLVATDRGVFRWATNRFVEFPVAFPVPNARVAHGLFEDRAGRLWLSAGGGFLLCREADDWRVFGQTNGLPSAPVTCLRESADGTLWAGTFDAGLFVLKGDRFHPFRPESAVLDPAIRSLGTDSEGNLWVGTRAGGASRLTRRRVTAYGASAGLANEFARSVAVAPDGTVWVATTGGGLFSARDGNFRPFGAGGQAEENRFIESVLTTRDGTLWWGGSSGLFSMIGMTIGMFAGASAAWLRGDSIQCLMADRTNGVWIGTALGQVRQFAQMRYGEPPVDFGRVACVALAQAADGTLWIGTGGAGLVRLRGANATTFSVEHGLGSRVIRALHLDRAGALWVGTGSAGLSVIEGDRVTTFTTRDGLPDDTISQILEDEDGHLWCGSNQGIFRLDPRDLRRLARRELDTVSALTLGKPEGMIAEECSSGSNPGAARLPSGLLCFTTVRGIVVVDPAQQQLSLRPPPVLIEQVTLDGTALAPHPPPAGEDDPEEYLPRVELPPGSVNLELAYTAPSFTAPNRVRFRYRMEPLDATWQDAQGRRAAYYMRLPPGRYTFRVSACNPDGIWNETGAALAVIVHPYFWQTWWFLVGLGVAVVAGIGAGVRFATQRKYARQMAALEMKAAIEQERSRIAKDIHDDLGANLTQITMLSEMGETALSDRGRAAQHFDRIARHARRGVQSLDEIVWAVNPKNDTLPRLVDYICRYVDEVFDNSGIRLWEDAPETLPAWPVRAEVRHNFFMAVKEATTNALKHSNASEAWLNIALEAEHLTLAFRDNGRGFAVADADFTRSGLKNMRARLTDVGGQFEMTSQPGHGTTVTLRIHLSPPPAAKRGG